MNPTDHPEHANDATPPAEHLEEGRKRREYGHSSGDRNTRTREGEWHEFSGGEQREAGPDDEVAPPDGQRKAP